MDQLPKNILTENLNSSIIDNENENIQISRKHIIKNLVVVSVGCLLAFCAYDGLVMLQSTINQEDGIGVISIAIQFSCGCITAILLPEYLFEKIGCKAVIAICLVLFVPYIAANFYPRWILMIPASILIGFANSLYWAAQSAYLNELSILYTKHLDTDEKILSSSSKLYSENSKTTLHSYDTELNHDSHSSNKIGSDSSKSSEKTIVSRIGKNENADIFISDIKTDEQGESRKHADLNESSSTTASKNLMITLITKLTNFSRNSYNLNNSMTTSKLLESTTARFFGIHGLIYQTCHIWSNLISYYVLRIGVVEVEYGRNSTCLCGASFCNIGTDCSQNNLREPRDDLRYILIGLFVALSILALLLVVFCLDELKKKRKNVSVSWQILISTITHMKNKKQLFLIPMSLNIGVSQGFIMSDFTRDYIGCAWGVHNVGLVTACLGASLALSSSISGWFVKHLGRIAIFSIAKLLNIVVIIILFLWEPDSSQPLMFFVISGILGIVLGTFWSQLRAFYGVLFKDKEGAAFANYQLWHAVGMAMAFAYSNYICTYYKIYIYAAFSTLGMIGYLLAERSYSLDR
ncbi:protein unc-93 homolog A [Nephila pilipes]|uniref:Protein unc-93 homolog A n=1 Tax=Nephila pilipes TaxID=299642 RepID=A0A8X6JHE2_NEPPI|nr:protein unc-93 homolog A [Nephila pilipes]